MKVERMVWFKEWQCGFDGPCGQQVINMLHLKPFDMDSTHQTSVPNIRSLPPFLKLPLFTTTLHLVLL